MAEKDITITNDLTICPICITTFTTPKYLSCLHTFCESCLNTWICHEVKGGAFFSCPVCRAKTTPPPSCNTKNPNQWASKFPNNHLIISLIDQNLISKKSKFCDSCEESGEHIEAVCWCVQCSEAYCESCVKAHRSMKITRRHKILSLQDVIKDLKQISSDEVCSEHEDEKVKLFCVDHDEPCCTICATVSHRKCDKVIELVEVADGVRDSEKFKNLMTNLSMSDDNIAEKENSIEQNIDELRKSKSNIEIRSKQLKQNAIDHVIKLQKQFEENLNTVHRTAVQSLKEKREMCILKQKVVKNSKDLLQKATQNASDSQLFLQMKKTETRQKESEDFINDELMSITKKDIQHKFSENLTSLTSDIKTFGSVQIINDRTYLRGSGNNTMFTFHSFIKTWNKKVRSIIQE